MAQFGPVSLLAHGLPCQLEFLVLFWRSSPTDPQRFKRTGVRKPQASAVKKPHQLTFWGLKKTFDLWHLLIQHPTLLDCAVFEWESPKLGCGSGGACWHVLTRFCEVENLGDDRLNVGYAKVLKLPGKVSAKASRSLQLGPESPHSYHPPGANPMNQAWFLNPQPPEPTNIQHTTVKIGQF